MASTAQAARILGEDKKVNKDAINK